MGICSEFTQALNDRKCVFLNICCKLTDCSRQKMVSKLRKKNKMEYADKKMEIDNTSRISTFFLAFLSF